MKKAVWLTGIFIIVFALVVGCYLLFSQEKNSKVPEGTFVQKGTFVPEGTFVQKGTFVPEGTRKIFGEVKGLEGMWGTWQRNV
ncbi:MAG: hypothetical protein K2N63_08560 [Lachnospiraceae bacterium]|nr:hypothetical protein [Lachnospiraceae bacterium]